MPAITTLIAFYLGLCGNTAKANPVIGNIFPDGTYQFQNTNQLAFTVTSSANITNITLSLSYTPLGGSGTILKIYGVGSGLTVTGTSTSNNVTAALASNTVYSATITAFDAGGNTTSTTWKFDTVAPGFYTWEAEDYDYTATNTGATGQFFDNPQIGSYAGKWATDGTDAHNTAGGGGYRPEGINGTNIIPVLGTIEGGLSTEGNGDTPRSQFTSSGKTDYDVGFNNNGNWAHYTRNYPAGAYYVFGRMANPNGAGTDSAGMSVATGTASLSAVGHFAVPNTGNWQVYQWVPLVDSGNNLVQLTVPDGGSGTSLNTFLLTTDPSGSYNANYYMLVPTNNINLAASGSSSIIFTNVYPDGLFQFEQASLFTFTLISTNGVAVDPTSIIVQLSGTKLLNSQALGTQILSGASGLTITGSGTNYTVTFALQPNVTYTAFIQALTVSGAPSSTTITFDTISAGNFTFETEDWDFSGGQYYDNPQELYAVNPGAPAANDYYLLTSIPEEDFHQVGGVSGYSTQQYRGDTGTSGLNDALNTEGANDKRRTQYTNSAPSGDYDNGFTHSGDWGNYTRHYPAGVWNLYLRAADGGGASVGGTVGVVTNGYQTTNQTVAPLGKFATVKGTGNWQVYEWVPLIDASGNLVKFDPSQYPHNTDGSLTLRYASGGGYNANFIMLVQADTTLPTVANLYPDGRVQFERTNKLVFSAASSLGIATNNVTLTLNGVDVSSNLVFAGSSTNWSVSYNGLQFDAVYDASINIKNSAGNTYGLSYGFNTWNPNYYQWESVDWNYTSNGVPGLYIENQLDAYRNLEYTEGVDLGQSNPNTLNNPFQYRPGGGEPEAATNLCPSQEVAGDTPRPQFLAAGLDEYKADYVENGTWMNYTRHFPTGTYHVWGTFTSGNTANTTATLSRVTSSPTAPNQTTQLLGTFTLTNSGWGTFQYSELLDNSSQPVTVTLDGSVATTLQFEGNPAGDGLTCNTGFFMLVPVASPLVIKASIVGHNALISFPTQSGHSYQVLWSASLNGGGSWTSLGSPIPGDGSTHSVSDPIGGGSRFYRVQVQ